MTDVESASDETAAVPAPSKNAGSQTLDRGLRALEMVAAAPAGMTMQEVADRLEVHRTIAHRLLRTPGGPHPGGPRPGHPGPGRRRVGGAGRRTAEHPAGHRRPDHAGAGRGARIHGGTARQ